FGELRRRQELLKEAGNLPNVAAYQTRREQGAALAPLPHLLVVIDEFSELLSARPDFAELFVTIGRIGRSIGVHLLLATQNLRWVASAAWSPTCRTESACAPSPKPRAAR